MKQHVPILLAFLIPMLHLCGCDPSEKQDETILSATDPVSVPQSEEIGSDPLSASEEQISASEEQISASEEQIPTSEEQIPTSEEQIPTIEELTKQLDGKFEYKITDDSVNITQYVGDALIVTIPSGVTNIDNFAFSNTPITSISIPKSVTDIGVGAFMGCVNLVEFLVSEDNTHFKSEDGILFSADGQKLIQVPAGNGLTEYTIPNSVTSIENSAFDSCEYLTSVTVPESVKSIDRGTFIECDKLTEIQVSAGNTHFKSVDGILFSADGKTLIQFPAGKELTEYTIPDGVTSIEGNAFDSCVYLMSVTIPESVTTIGDSAFFWCMNLTSVTIPDRVTSIDDRVFSGCSSLKSVTIPDGVTSIGDHAFDGCKSLTSVTIPDGVTSIEVRTFRGCESLTSVTIPENVTSIGEAAFSLCKSLETVTISNSVTSIEDNAFNSCSSLTSVTIPESVTSIGGSAFASCWNLTEIHASADNTHFKSVDGILFSADGKTLVQFPAGKELTEYTIPDGVTSIGDAAFCGNKNLTSVTISEGVTSIGARAFEACMQLRSVTIPESVTNIEESVFSNAMLFMSHGKIRGKAGSKAEEFATEHSIQFQAIE